MHNATVHGQEGGPVDLYWFVKDHQLVLLLENQVSSEYDGTSPLQCNILRLGTIITRLLGCKRTMGRTSFSDRTGMIISLIGKQNLDVIRAHFLGMVRFWTQHV